MFKKRIVIVFIYFFYHDRVMAKRAGDIMLRDRMEFTLDGDGNRSTVYGRIDLSSYISVTQKKGLAVKEIYFHVREQNSTKLDLTGIWDYQVGDIVANENGHVAGLKVYATTRAYENAADVGIASPDVICVREFTSYTSPNGSATAGTSYAFTDHYYGARDLHPEGFTLVSDLLIGVAADNYLTNADSTLEVDILMIAEEVTVSQERMNDMLQQAQDL